MSGSGGCWFLALLVTYSFLSRPPHRSSAPSHSMSSRRDTDSDTQDANDSSCKSSERSLPDCTPHPNSISIDAGPRQAPKIAQIKRNLSYGDNSDPALEASSLPPPDPWLETSSSSPAEPAQPGACRRDGYWFLKLLQAETERLEGWCCQMDKETKENNLSEEGGSCKGIWCHATFGAPHGGGSSVLGGLCELASVLILSTCLTRPLLICGLIVATCCAGCGLSHTVSQAQHLSDLHKHLVRTDCGR